MRAAYPFENTSAKPALCLGSSSSSSRMASAPYTRNTTRCASSWRPLFFSHRGDSGTLHLPISRKTQGTMVEPSMSLHPPSTSHKAKPTTAATVASKYHAAETMPIDIARWCLGGGEFRDERGRDGVVGAYEDADEEAVYHEQKRRRRGCRRARRCQRISFRLRRFRDSFLGCHMGSPWPVSDSRQCVPFCLKKA